MRTVLSSILILCLTLTANFAHARIGRQSVSYLNNRYAIDGHGLIALYDFVQGANPQVLYDVSGNGHHGTLGSGSGSDSSDPTWVPGGGITLDGVNDYISLPNTAAFDVDNATIGIVARVNASNTGVLFSKGGSASPAAAGMYFQVHPSSCIVGKNSSGANVYVASCSGFATGEVVTFSAHLFYSLGTSFSSTVAKDGVSVQTGAPVTGNGDDSTSEIPRIGVRSQGNNVNTFWAGTIYTLAIYRRALTPSDHQRAHLTLSRP